jgi:hypothetical protein
VWFVGLQVFALAALGPMKQVFDAGLGEVPLLSAGLGAAVAAGATRRGWMPGDAVLAD